MIKAVAIILLAAVWAQAESTECSHFRHGRPGRVDAIEAEFKKCMSGCHDGEHGSCISECAHKKAAALVALNEEMHRLCGTGTPNTHPADHPTPHPTRPTHTNHSDDPDPNAPSHGSH